MIGVTEVEKGWQTEHGDGRWRIFYTPDAGSETGWYWEVTWPKSPAGVSSSTGPRGPYRTKLGADRAAWNAIKRWEEEAEKAAVWRAHGR